MVFNDIDNLYIGNEAQDKIYLGDFLVWSGGTQPVPTQPNDEIWYTTNDNATIYLRYPSIFGVNIVSNTYTDGKGIIKFDGNVTTIGEWAFESCSNMTTLSFPDSLTVFGRYITYRCNSLLTVTLGNAVTSIGDYGFRNTPALTSVICHTPTPFSKGSDMLMDADNAVIYVPAASVNAYKAEWTDYASRIQAIPE